MIPALYKAARASYMLSAKHGGEMTWHDFLREERRRKLTANELMAAGRIGTSTLQNGVRVDTTEEAIATNMEHIAEIETILTESGERFDA